VNELLPDHKRFQLLNFLRLLLMFELPLALCVRLELEAVLLIQFVLLLYVLLTPAACDVTLRRRVP